jgi:hypothetical protein
MNNHMDQLALIVASAYYIPNKDLRDSLQSKLISLNNSFNYQKVKELLLNEKGTEIDPFCLTKEDIDCVATLASLAFLIGETRLRVVSRDSLGFEGGLVITSNLKSFYLKRYQKNNNGTPYGQPKGGWVFIPSQIPKDSKEYKTYLIPDKEGFTISTKLPPSSLHPFGVKTSLERGSRIEGLDTSLDKLGLKFEENDGILSIRSGSPESVIKLMAHMINNSKLILRDTEDENDLPRIEIALAPPENKKVLLESITYSTPNYCSWMRGTCDKRLIEKISLSREEIQATSKWILPHKSWAL